MRKLAVCLLAVAIVTAGCDKKAEEEQPAPAKGPTKAPDKGAGMKGAVASGSAETIQFAVGWSTSM